MNFVTKRIDCHSVTAEAMTSRESKAPRPKKKVPNFGNRGARYIISANYSLIKVVVKNNTGQAAFRKSGYQKMSEDTSSTAKNTGNIKMRGNYKNKIHLTLQSSRLWHRVMWVISRRFRGIWSLNII